MATEFEYKAILKNPYELIARYEEPARPVSLIEQVYTIGGARFRRIHDGHYGQPFVRPPRHIFTYKETIEDNVLEMEQAASIDDFSLALKAAERRMTKYRFKEFADIGTWDVDFQISALKDGQILFAMAEYETTKGLPPVIAPALEPFIDFIIPIKDNMYFSNYSLCNPEYTRTVVSDYKIMRNLT